MVMVWLAISTLAVSVDSHLGVMGEGSYEGKLCLGVMGVGSYEGELCLGVMFGSYEGEL